MVVQPEAFTRTKAVVVLSIAALTVISGVPTPQTTGSPSFEWTLIDAEGRSVEDMLEATGLPGLPGSPGWMEREDLRFKSQVPLGGAPSPGVTGGHSLWESRYAGNAAGWSIPHDVAVDPLGQHVYVTGESVSSGTWQKFVTIGYDAVTGAPAWESRYSGDTIWSEVATGVTVAPDGSRVYVTGYGQNPGTGLDYTTLAYDAATGTELWVTHYSGPGGGWDIPEEVLVSPDGATLYVTGYSELGTNWVFEAATVAYDTDTGDILWSARHAGPAGQAYGLGADLSRDGDRLVTTGMSLGSNDFDVLTVSYDPATGDEQWTSVHDGTANGFDLGRDVAIAPDGSRVFVTAESDGVGTRSDLVTLGLDAQNGQEVWNERYDGPAEGWEWSSGLVVTPDGQTVVAAGTSESSNVVDYVALAYDTDNGEVSWVHRHDGPGNEYDAVHDIVIDGTGSRIYLTGQSWDPSTAYDMTTLALDTQGEEVWISRYNGPVSQRDYGTALAVDPLGLRAYAAGYSTGNSGDLDYYTIAHLVDEQTLVDAATGVVPAP